MNRKKLIGMLAAAVLMICQSVEAQQSAKLALDFCQDLTPPAEFEKQCEFRLQHVLAREKGSGRPTKRDRREIDRLFR